MKSFDAIGGDTFEDPQDNYIDELDEFDNVNVRLDELKKYYDTEYVKPEVEWRADGVVARPYFSCQTKELQSLQLSNAEKRWGLKM